MTVVNVTLWPFDAGGAMR